MRHDWKFLAAVISLLASTYGYGANPPLVPRFAYVANNQVANWSFVCFRSPLSHCPRRKHACAQKGISSSSMGDETVGAVSRPEFRSVPLPVSVLPFFLPSSSTRSLATISVMYLFCSVCLSSQERVCRRPSM